MADLPRLGGRLGVSQSGSDTGPEFLGTGLPPGICPVTELPLAPAAAATAGKSTGGIHAPLPEVERLLPGEEDVAFYEGARVLRHSEGA